MVGEFEIKSSYVRLLTSYNMALLYFTFELSHSEPAVEGH